MNIQLIRNATLKINYAGKIILLDPMLCKKETMPPFMKGLKKNPTVGLPISVDEIIKNIDAVMVTHSHPDHFDSVSSEVLDKDIPIFATPTDKEFFLKQNFNNVTIVKNETTWEDIKITRIEGQHGSGTILPYMGEVSGYVLQSNDNPTIYIISDTILIEPVISTITNFKPDIIVTNSGNGIFPGHEQYPVIMDEKQTIEVAKLAPKATIIAVHIESIDFNKTTRKSLRDVANKNDISEEQLRIPNDGEEINLK